MRHASLLSLSLFCALLGGCRLGVSSDEPDLEVVLKGPLKPVAEGETQIRLRAAGLGAIRWASVKHGQRNQTERIRSHQELDINRLPVGFFTAASLNYGDLWTVGGEYMRQADPSPGRHTQGHTLRANRAEFQAGTRTRSRSYAEWTRIEVGLPFRSPGRWVVELLVGLRYTSTELAIHQGRNRSRARVDYLHLYVPGVDASFAFLDGWMNMEFRGSFLSQPFGAFVTDYRISQNWEWHGLNFGFGALATLLSSDRPKEWVFNEKANRIRAQRWTSLGAFAQVGVQF